eukprot:scaffold76602_cov63-Phaeocystis_antarctica.AAC.3
MVQSANAHSLHTLTAEPCAATGTWAAEALLRSAQSSPGPAPCAPGGQSKAQQAVASPRQRLQHAAAPLRVACSSPATGVHNGA